MGSMVRHITADDVRAARERISGRVRRTWLEESVYLGRRGRRCFYKLESQQLGKSFKIRGALNALRQLDLCERARGVGVVSTGNSAVAVACAAQMLGIENCLAIVPTGTPRAKLDRIRFYGGRAMTMGANYGEAVTLGLTYLECSGMYVLDAFGCDPDIYAGAGTIGLEILEQNPELDTIVVPIGAGGLATGVAVGARSVRPDVRVIGVQTEACPAMYESIRHGTCYNTYPVSGETVCGAIVGGVGRIAYEMLPSLLDDIVVVSERSIRDAVRFMIEEEQIVAEAASAMVVAAARDYADLVGGTNVALVISGGNIDARLLERLLAERA